MSRRLLGALVVMSAVGCSSRDLPPPDAKVDSPVDMTVDGGPLAPDTSVAEIHPETARPDSSVAEIHVEAPLPDTSVVVEPRMDGSIPDLGGPDGDGGACAPDPAAPVSTSSPPRPTVPWTAVAPADAGTDAAADAGSTGDAGPPSGCVWISLPGPIFTTSDPRNVTCRGTATGRGEGTAVSLAFADGSLLRWQVSAGSPIITPPPVVDGQSVWVDYSRRVTQVNPTSGAYWTTLLEIRSAANGPLLWIGREGVDLQELTPDLVNELFGVGVHEQLNCMRTIAAGCLTGRRRVFDHILETTPTQLIPAATLRHVISPRGEYQVFWAHSIQDDIQPVPNCADGPNLGSDTSFAASRAAPARD